MNEKVNSLYGALAKAQAEMPPAVFNRVNPHFRNRYADLASLRAATVPSLSKHGLSIIQYTVLTDRGFLLKTRLAHESGDFIEGEYPLPNEPSKPQVMGSALTYARRYGWGAIIGEVSDEDDDAEAATKRNGAGEADYLQEPVTEAQLRRIECLMEETDSDPIRFCRHFKIDALPDLIQSQVPKAISLLEEKKRSKA